MRKISLIVPCHNEEEALPVFMATVVPIMEATGHAFEIVCVDDGSRDATVAVLRHLREKYPAIRVITLSRNFGKEAAMTAGFSFASGDAVIPMDADLQDPPELIPEMIAQWNSGYQVVLALRRDRSSDTLLKRSTARAFYRLMGKITHVPIPENAGDYRLMDRQVVNAILAFPERNRFMKGLMAAAGFRQTSVWYDRPERSAGTTKFNFWRLWNFALDGITSFSTFPLRVWTYLGLAVAAISFMYAGWIVLKTWIWGVVTPGYATMLTVMLLLGGLQMIGLGVLGEYVGRLVLETKRRPLYFVANTYGFEEDREPIVITHPRLTQRSAL